jgi:hypothetical protein
MKRLIVNADDYGYTPGVSEGIRRAHRHGIVTSTTVMMTMPHAAAELEKLATEAPTLGVGVHLTVTDGVPFRLDHIFSRQQVRDELAALDAAELRAEWAAQIETFLTTGLTLTHLDSHHHATYWHERPLTVLFDLARSYGVPIRCPYPFGDPNVDPLAESIANSGVNHPRTFVDVFDKQRDAGTLIHALESLPDGVTEFMVHPGVVDDELRRFRPTLAHIRAEEMEALIDPRAQTAVQKLGIELVSFAALAA